MRQQRICVAGLSERNGHVRPLPSSGNLVRSQIPGTWALGRVVQLGPTVAIGAAPRWEDRTFNLAAVTVVEEMSAAGFWKRLSDEADDSLSLIFGSAFSVNRNRKGFVLPGQGDASLGLLRLGDKPTIYDDFDGDPRMRFSDGTVTVDCSITDVRLRRSDNTTLNATAADELRALVENSGELILSVGLGYGFPPEDPKHWLQVNNVHCSGEPLWRAT